jgi:hypothetical protein
MKNTYLSIFGILSLITITTPAMASGRVLTCFYDNPEFKNSSINIFVDEQKSEVIFNYQTTKGHEEIFQIKSVEDKWISADSLFGGKFVINKNNGRWGLTWLLRGTKGVPQGGYVKGICHGKPFK